MFRWKLGVSTSWQLSRRQSKGFAHLLPIIVLAGLFVGVVVVANIGKSIKLRTDAQVGGGSPSDVLSSLTWEDCIKIPGSIEEQTFPPICVAPDGRRVTGPTSTGTTTPAPTPINAIGGSRPGTLGVATTPAASLTWEDCIKIPGSVKLLTFPPICVAPDGRRVTGPTSTGTMTPTDAPINAIGGSRPGIRGTPGVLRTPVATTPATSFTWEDCIKIPGSVKLLTFPPICVAPDGRRVTGGTNVVPVTANSSPITGVVYTISTFIGTILGGPAQFLRNLFSSN